MIGMTGRAVGRTQMMAHGRGRVAYVSRTAAVFGFVPVAFLRGLLLFWHLPCILSFKSQLMVPWTASRNA